MTTEADKKKAREILRKTIGVTLAGDYTSDYIAQALSEARASQIEKDAGIAKERARIMNVLGSDAQMHRTITNAEIQAERVLEAQTIEQAIRSQK